MEEQYEHFNMMIDESRRKRFYVSTRGYAFSVDNFSGKITVYAKNKHGGQVRVPIHSVKFGDQPNLKKLVWYAAKGENIDGNRWNLVCKDGDEMNCSIENLQKKPRKEVSAKTGKMASRKKAVMVREFRKEPIRYESVRDAAKALYCSYQTLSDYLNGTEKHRKRSVLWKWGRKIYYA